MAVQTQRKLFTVSDYYKMAEVGILGSEDRVELLHGEIIEKGSIKSFHASIVDTLHELLVLSLRGNVIVKSQNLLRIDDYSEPEPDLIIAHFHDHKYRHQHPRPKDVYFLIEVADTTLSKDRKIKLPLYAEAGIAVVWIVNLKNHSVEVHSNPLKGTYQAVEILKIGDVLHVEALGFSLEVAQIFG